MELVSTYYNGVPGINGVRTVKTGSSVAMITEDYEVIINKTVSSPTSVVLPPQPTAGQNVVVSDGKGDIDVGVNNITVSTSDGTFINGAATLIIQAPFQSVRFRFSDTGQWNPIS